jgi:hypothetical protein
MLIFTGIRPMMDELLNIEYRRNTLSRSDASEVHTKTYRQTVFQKSLSYSGALKTCKPVKISILMFHDHNIFSYYVQEKVKSIVRYLSHTRR